MFIKNQNMRNVNLQHFPLFSTFKWKIQHAVEPECLVLIPVQYWFFFLTCGWLTIYFKKLECLCVHPQKCVRPQKSWKPTMLSLSKDRAYHCLIHFRQLGSSSGLAWPHLWASSGAARGPRRQHGGSSRVALGQPEEMGMTSKLKTALKMKTTKIRITSEKDAPRRKTCKHYVNHERVEHQHNYYFDTTPHYNSPPHPGFWLLGLFVVEILLVLRLGC